ncbi:FecR family protein [Alcaligenes nematophilus]|uniref:FecR family protein n=1 Tax=Alcaligenes nematophilus TaxID=2994643 RepID=A0ABU3MVD8_9BURK|nr:FecR family protein [Alcaligenes nematophilus]MDT8466211.1 FecR family protein [Alcaligenes nematophilus]MDT8469436.1 FecR family protein [Alcaligenes nematophilus]MDT8504249.1 FecR family protein [Alcaligenes nematophilus]MDT8525248.1 FecR family protein [Alcaligenes nematophilus]
MTDRIDPATLTDPRDQAAYWYERMQSDDVTATERLAFEQWQLADSDNEQRYQQVQFIWSMAAALPKSEVQKLGRAQGPAVNRRPSSRAFWSYGLGVACVAVLTVAVVDPMHWRAVPEYQAQFATAHGERREIVLPDDSTLLLNTDTSLTVALYGHQRTVRLEQGEVFFQVDGTQGTPFVVEMESGAVRVTGTQFNVRRIDQAFSVDVLQGSVQVSTGPWWRRQLAMLRPGDVARVTKPDHLRSGKGTDVENSVAWREGKVVFRGTSLADAVQELNRYSAERLVVSDPQIAGLRVSGVFNIDDPASFLAALPHIVPVHVQPRPDGTAVDILAR